MTESSYTQNNRGARARVLVVDNDWDIRTRRAEQLESWGYTPILAEGAGEDLLLDAEQKARAYRCQIALVDMRLLEDQDSSDFSGLELVPKLKPTISMIVSGFGDVSSVRSAFKDHGAFDFVGKQRGPKAIQGALDDLERHYEIGRYRPRISWSHGLDSAKIRDLLFPDDSTIPPEEADDLIGRIFSTALSVHLSLIDDEMESPVTDIPQSFSHGSRLRHESRIFRVIVDDQPAIQVLKLARPARITQEVDNYKRNIENGLWGAFRPEMTTYMVLWDMGAVAYRHIGGADGQYGELQTFTRYYRQTNHVEQIVRPLHHFFEESWGQLYSRRQPINAQSLFDAYDTAWQGSLSQRLTHWRNHEQRCSFPGLPVVLPNPTRWLADHKDNCFHVQQPNQAVTHGDLHGDNLFVNAHHAWPIDFERAGPGPILRDFVELIQDIIVRIAQLGDDDLPIAHYEMVVALCAPRRPTEDIRMTETIFRHREARKAFYVIEEILHIAYDRVRYQDQRELLWGLLLYNLVIATRLEEKTPRRAFVLLFAAVICARLDCWDERVWPPSSWKQPLWLDDEERIRYEGKLDFLWRELQSLEAQHQLYETQHVPGRLADAMDLVRRQLSEFGEDVDKPDDMHRERR